MKLSTLVWRELSSRPTALFAATLAIVLSVAALVTIRHITEFSERAVGHQLQQLGANILILPESTTLQDYYTADLSDNTLPESHVSAILLENLAGVERLSPRLCKSTTVAERTVTVTGNSASERIRIQRRLAIGRSIRKAKQGLWPRQLWHGTARRVTANACLRTGHRRVGGRPNRDRLGHRRPDEPRTRRKPSSLRRDVQGDRDAGTHRYDRRQPNLCPLAHCTAADECRRSGQRHRSNRVLRRCCDRFGSTTIQPATGCQSGNHLSNCCDPGWSESPSTTDFTVGPCRARRHGWLDCGWDNFGQRSRTTPRSGHADGDWSHSASGYLGVPAEGGLVGDLRSPVWLVHRRDHGRSSRRVVGRPGNHTAAWADLCCHTGRNCCHDHGRLLACSKCSKARSLHLFSGGLVT